MIIENPTIEQKRKIKNIIYLIVNLTNFRCYVGLTVQTFAGRYRTTKWWNKLENKELKSDILRLGIDNFQVMFLEQNITDIIELNNLEHLYATIYDCYYPYGYNVAICGRKENYRDSILKGRIKCRESNRKYKLKDQYEFICPNGNKILIKDIIKFCEENELNYHRMLEVDRQASKHHRGYSNPNNPLKFYDLISPDGIIFKVKEGDFTKFTIEHKISETALTFLTREHCKFYCGWRLLKNRHVKQPIQFATLVSPEGQIYKVDNFISFAKENNLDYSTIRKVVNGKKKQYKNWKLKI